MMDKAIVGTVLAICIGSGACIGGMSSANEERQYHDALRDPDFYHLVDEAGECISEELVVDGVSYSVRQEVENPHH